jgi:hypothetical protein
MVVADPVVSNLSRRSAVRAVAKQIFATIAVSAANTEDKTAQ